MLTFIVAHILQPLGSALAILLAVSLIWCGDAGCQSGAADDQCASMICALYANHSGTTKDESTTHADCTCVCHVPAIVADSLAVVLSPPLFQRVFESTFFIPSSPNRAIYRPPLTA
jgi:hypothetical protein